MAKLSPDHRVIDKPVCADLNAADGFEKIRKVHAEPSVEWKMPASLSGVKAFSFKYEVEFESAFSICCCSVIVVLVKIAIISSASVIRALIMSGPIQCLSRSYQPRVSRAEAREKSRKRTYSARLRRP